MKRSFREYFNVAHDLTKKSGHPRFHHGSIVVYRKNIIGKGANYGFLHAEVSSLINCEHVGKSSRDKLTVFVCRVNSQGLFMNSKPCENCQEYMRRKGIKKVFYTVDDSTIGRLYLE